MEDLSEDLSIESCVLKVLSNIRYCEEDNQNAQDSNGLKIVTTSPSFPQCVERESRRLKTKTGCPIENFGHDRQIEMIFHSIMRLLISCRAGHSRQTA